MVGTNQDDKAIKLLEYNNAILPTLKHICSPLNKFNISNVIYAKLTRDKKHFRLGTHEKWNELYFHHKVHDSVIPLDWAWFHHSSNTKESALSCVWNGSFFNQEVNTLASSVNLANGITFFQVGNNYIEAFGFSGSLEDNALFNFYLNNQDILKKFIHYFKIAAKDIIEIPDKYKMIALHDDLEKSSFSHFDQEKIEDFTQRIFTRKLRLTTLQKDFNVSARELECLKYKSQGMTAKEIAKKCDISHRTVETHLNKIRINSDLNIHQLINLCRKVGLF